MARRQNMIPMPKPPPESIYLPHDKDKMLRQNYLWIPQMEPMTGNVEGTKNKNNDETSKPKVVSLGCINEDQSGSSNQPCSKKIPSQLNAMAARAARVARRLAMNSRRSKRSQR